MKASDIKALMESLNKINTPLRESLTPIRGNKKRKIKRSINENSLRELAREFLTSYDETHSDIKKGTNRAGVFMSRDTIRKACDAFYYGFVDRDDGKPGTEMILKIGSRFFKILYDYEPYDNPKEIFPISTEIETVRKRVTRFEDGNNVIKTSKDI